MPRHPRRDRRPRFPRQLRPRPARRGGGVSAGPECDAHRLRHQGPLLARRAGSPPRIPRRPEPVAAFRPGQARHEPAAARSSAQARAARPAGVRVTVLPLPQFPPRTLGAPAPGGRRLGGRDRPRQQQHQFRDGFSRRDREPWLLDQRALRQVSHHRLGLPPPAEVSLAQRPARSSRPRTG